MVFGRLTVVKQAEDYVDKNGKHKTCWLCKCKCGNDNCFVLGSSLTKKNRPVQSCGCLQKEKAKKYCEENKKIYNDYEVQEDYVIMYTTKGEPFFVDLEDFWRVKDICWHKRIDDDYIEGNYHGSPVLLHRFIMSCPDNLLVDHIRGKKSKNDNRKYNLRIANKSQNGQNRGLSSCNQSGCTGVWFDKRRNKWRVRLSINRKEIHLGYYDTIEEATKVRKEAENKYYGEFSYDNSQKLANSS